MLTLLFRVALLVALATCGAVAVLQPVLGLPGRPDPGHRSGLPTLQLSQAGRPLGPSR